MVVASIASEQEEILFRFDSFFFLSISFSPSCFYLMTLKLIDEVTLAKRFRLADQFQLSLSLSLLCVGGINVEITTTRVTRATVLLLLLGGIESARVSFMTSSNCCYSSLDFFFSF